jgi:hypothetical protein
MGPGLRCGSIAAGFRPLPFGTEMPRMVSGNRVGGHEKLPRLNRELAGYLRELASPLPRLHAGNRGSYGSGPPVHLSVSSVLDVDVDDHGQGVLVLVTLGESSLSLAEKEGTAPSLADSRG